MKRFDDAFRVQLRELLIWRRDVRRFRTEALPPGTIERLIDLACLAPSVGLSQPWRFVIVDDPARRRAVLDDFRSLVESPPRGIPDSRHGVTGPLRVRVTFKQLDRNACLGEGPTMSAGLSQYSGH
jgi:nitroreductase